MRSFSTADRVRSVAIPERLDGRLRTHLVRPDGQEDLCFALWAPSVGAGRSTALLNEIILPERGDRQVHGNVSFNPQYLERACRLAAKAGLGVAFLHSHPAPGWQGMSPDDIRAEQRMVGAVEGLTDLPLLGLTIGSDGYWSARFWSAPPKRRSAISPQWCERVRVAGNQLTVSFHDGLVPPPEFRELFKRTATVWGAEKHRRLARLRIGIVGLGSVGSLVAEMLVRMGLTDLVLIDFDEVQPHNLDRLNGATLRDIGQLKIDVARRHLRGAATAKSIRIECVPYSIAEEAGYRAALDCDVIFCCVDRPRARSILNHIAYAHLIPVIDGGIAVRFRNEEFRGADWQVQTVGPGRVCLDCLSTFLRSDVEAEMAGMLDDPSYLQGLPADHRFKRNENVFPFSAHLASMEIFHLIALATGAGGMDNFGVQRFRYMPGHLDTIEGKQCSEECCMGHLTARGDLDFQLYGQDVGAESARRRQQAARRSGRWSRFLSRARDMWSWLKGSRVGKPTS